MGVDETRTAAHNAGATVQAKAQADARELSAAYEIEQAEDDPGLHRVTVYMRVDPDSTPDMARAAFSDALVEIAARIETGEP